MNRPNSARVWLRRLLLFNGILTLCALPAVFLPNAWMDTIHRQLELGPLPQAPVVEYLARSISVLYATFGALTLFLAHDPTRYAPLIGAWSMAAIVGGGLFLGIDCVAGMPATWTLSEGPYLALVGVIGLFLWRKSNMA